MSFFSFQSPVQSLFVVGTERIRQGYAATSKSSGFDFCVVLKGYTTFL